MRTFLRRTGNFQRAAALLLGLLVSRSSLAQSSLSVLTGVVRDRAAAPVAGALVQATSLPTGLARETTTNDAGVFVIGGLPVDGTYVLRASRSGFTTAVMNGLTVVPGMAVAVDLVLDLAAGETVVVTEVAAPLLDTAHASPAQVLTSDWLRALPTDGRHVLALAAITAGFTGHPDFPNPNGQRYSTNGILVDHASHFSAWRGAARAFYSGYGIESVQQLAVQTRGFSAEFGEALTSLTMLTTREGTAAWHGSALLFSRHSALDSPPPFAVGKPPGHGEHVAASLGGPLGAGRTHLFLSYDGSLSRERHVVIAPMAAGAVVPDDQDEHIAFARADHTTVTGLRLSLRYNGQRVRWHEEPGGITLPGSGTAYRSDGHTLLFTGAMQTATTAHEVHAQVSRYRDLRHDLEPGVYVSRAGYSLEGGRRGPAGFGVDPEDAVEVADTWSWWSPRQIVRLGGSGTWVRTRSVAQPDGYGAYFFAGAPDAYPLPFQFTQGLAPSPDATEAHARSVLAAGFVQDDLRLRAGVTLNLGLRYDVERVSGVRGAAAIADRNNAQPRLGLAWDVGQQGRTVVRAGAGLYTQRHLLFPLSQVALQGTAGVVTVTVPAGSPLMLRVPDVLAEVPTALLPPRDLFRVTPSLRNPQSVQASVGVERLVLGHAVAVDVMRLDGLGLLSLLDLNAPASVQKPAQRTVAQADLTRPLVPATGTFRQMLTLGNEGRSWYSALQVRVTRARGAFQTFGSYTLARADDQLNGELPEDSLNPSADRGPAAADVRHNATGAVTWSLPGARAWLRAWSVSGVLAVRSGRPYTVTWGDDRNGTTQGDARPGGRNTARTGTYRTIDASLVRRFHSGGRTIDARADLFNVLNSTNFDQYVGALLSPLYSQPVSAFPQRRLQLALIARF